MNQQDQWYVLDETAGASRAMGPLGWNELASMVAVGSLRPSTRVARVGTDVWTAASSDPGLVQLFEAAAAPLPARAASALTSDYSFQAAFELGWNTFKSRWINCLLLGLVYTGCVIVVVLPQLLSTILIAAIDEGSLASDSTGARAAGTFVLLLGSCIGYVLQVVVGIPLLAGTIYASAQIVRGQPKIDDIFQGFRRYRRALLTGLVFTLVSVVGMIAAYIPAALAGVLAIVLNQGSNQVATVVAIVVGVALALVGIILIWALVLVRLIFALGVAIDPTLGDIRAIDALKLSWNKTKGLGWSLLGLLLVATILYSLSVLLLCVGIFLVGIPLFLAILGAAYALVFRDRSASGLTTPSMT